jgi:hypothetical protein
MLMEAGYNIRLLSFVFDDVHEGKCSKSMPRACKAIIPILSLSSFPLSSYHRKAAGKNLSFLLFYLLHSG